MKFGIAYGPPWPSLQAHYTDVPCWKKLSISVVGVSSPNNAKSSFPKRPTSAGADSPVCNFYY